MVFAARRLAYDEGTCEEVCAVVVASNKYYALDELELEYPSIAREDWVVLEIDPLEFGVVEIVKYKVA